MNPEKGPRPAMAVGAIVLLHLAGFALFHDFYYRHVNLCCGDSAFYLFLARNLGLATPDRPSGWPFLLHGLLALSRDPRLLVVFNSLLSLGAHLLVYDLARREIGWRAGLLLALLLAANPAQYSLDYMAYMADTLGASLAVLAIWMFHRAFLARAASASWLCGMALVWGSAAIVKSVFLYVGLLAAIAGSALFLHASSRPFRHRLLLAALPLAVFLSIPALYANTFAKPRLGKAIVEGMGGRSALANIMPHLGGCSALARLASDDAQRNVVRAECNDADLREQPPAVLLWGPQSVLNRIGDRLDPGQGIDHRLGVNRIFQRWVLRAALREPLALLRAMGNSLAAMVRTPLVAGDGTPLFRGLERNLAGGCESLVRQIFGANPDEYRRALSAHAERTRTLVSRVEGIGSLFWYLATALSAIPIVAAALLLARGAPTLRARTAVVIALLSLAYLGLVALGSQYDARYYLAWHDLAIMALAATWGAWRESRPAVAT